MVLRKIGKMSTDRQRIADLFLQEAIFSQRVRMTRTSIYVSADYLGMFAFCITLAVLVLCRARGLSRILCTHNGILPKLELAVRKA